MLFSKHSGYSPDGRRLCHKGGDGGAGEMRAMEEDRQRKIQDAVNVINDIFDPKAYQQGINAATKFDPNQTYYNKDGSQYEFATDMKSFLKSIGTGNPYKDMFNQVAAFGAAANNPEILKQWQAKNLDKINEAISRGELFTGVETVQPENSREKLYDDQKQAVYDINAKEVNDQYARAERANRFGLARNGLLGGSTDIYSNANLQEKTNEGLVQAKALGEEAASQLRSADENSKASLISMAQSGIDTGTAQQMAAAQLAASKQSALGSRGGASIGNLFDSLGQAYLAKQAMSGMQNGYNQYQNQYGNLSTRSGDQGRIGR